MLGTKAVPNLRTGNVWINIAKILLLGNALFSGVSKLLQSRFFVSEMHNPPHPGEVLRAYLVVPAKSNFSNFPLAKLGSASFKLASRLVLVNHRTLPNLRQPNQPHDERQKAFQP